MQHTIEKMSVKDAEATIRLFYDIIDELHADASEFERKHYKDAYSINKIEDRLGDNNSMYLVAKEGDRVVGFLFAWLSEGIGHINWIGVSRAHRKKGCGKSILEAAVKEFEMRHCHEVKLFTYPSQVSAYKLFQSVGFEEKAYIDEQFFGVSIILMVRKLKDGRNKLSFSCKIYREDCPPCILNFFSKP